MTAAVDDATTMAALEALEPGFLPERLAGAGAALIAALAHDVALVETALAAAPDKYFLAFLDAMGLTLLPPAPARAPLVFGLAADAPVDLSLPRATEVAAVLPPPLPGSLAAPAADAPAADPIVFATEQEISLTRAKLVAALSLLPEDDEQADHGPAVTSGFTLFDATARIDHHLYLGDERLFDLPGNARVTVHVSVESGPQAQAVALKWEYATADGWLEFAPVHDRTHGLVYDGEVVLEKLTGARTVKQTIAGREAFWIRARTDARLSLPGTGDTQAPLPRLDTLRARVGLGENGLALDVAYADGIAVDTSKDFSPFGPPASSGSTFAIACDTAFKREDAYLTLELVRSTGTTPTPSQHLELVWEYSTGPGTWERLIPEAGELLDGDVAFLRPRGWVKAPFNGAEHYWLRVRIAAGDYGPPVTYTIAAGVVNPSAGPQPPSFKRMAVGYRFETAPQAPAACLTLNRFDVADVTQSARFGRPGFQPFEPVDDLGPTVDLGFDAPLPLGLVSLFVDVPGQTEAVDPPQSPFTWEYRSADEWHELAVLDETDGFRRRGLVQFVGPPDIAPTPGPSGRVYWIRARLKIPGGLVEPLPVAAIHLNGVWATHRQVVRGEAVGRSDGSPRLTLAVQHPPVLEDETVEVQEWAGRGREWQGLFADVDPDALRIDRDPRGEPTAVWVRWTERPYLYSSGPHERHYTLERTAGLLRFGDGVAGMIPPPGSLVSASYVWGGGTRGNVPAGTITQLHSAVPYVESVSNVADATGGTAAETPDAVRARGPHHLRHRDRALSAADYEWLARETSAEVAWARCIPATGPDGILRPGWVTVAIAPGSGGPRPEPSPELLRRVHDVLAARAPAAIARSIRVIGPDYQPISVVTEIVISDAGGAARVEELLRARIDAFLHPLTGGPYGQGWELAGYVHLSSVARIVERTPGVDHARSLQLAVEGGVYGDRLPVEPGRLPIAGRHVIKLRLGGVAVPLPVPKLDSRDWEELVVESRSLLPRAAPDWTDHNLHDPGITLLELFAWLTELLLYRSDRVSPAMQRAFLRLVGVVPRPPRPARTVVTIDGAATVAEGTQLVDASAAPLFETTRTLTPTAARLVAVHVESGGVRTDRTVDNGRGLPPFGAAPAPGDALLLGFDRRPLAPGAELSLHAWTPTWVEDDGERGRLEEERTAVLGGCPADPLPSWPTRTQCAERTPALAPTAGPPGWWRHYGVTTVWEHQNGAEWAPLQAEDETRALTLTGGVRVVGPASHPVDPATGRWWIRCRVAAGRYECPPRILAVAVNAVAARHAVAARGPEQLGATRGEAGRTVKLRHRPVLAGSTALRFGADASWIEVSEWDTCGPDDRCYRLDPEAGTIELGNGRRGRVPPAGTAVEATAYRIGGGAGGNLRAGTLVAAAGVAAAVVRQPHAAQGGTDPEPLGRAHGRALDLLGRASRGVTVADLERLALETPGVPVGRARAIAGHHPAFPCLGAEGCVTVVVLPRCGTPPGAGFVAAVRRYLERRRPLTVELHVTGADFEPLQVRATLAVAPGGRAGVAAAGEAALRDFFDPIAGGPEGGGWPFGRDVLESEVLAVLAGVDGVVYADDLMLARDDRWAPTCGNLGSCPTALVDLRAVALTVTEETRP